MTDGFYVDCFFFFFFVKVPTRVISRVGIKNIYLEYDDRKRMANSKVSVVDIFPYYINTFKKFRFKD